MRTGIYVYKPTTLTIQCSEVLEVTSYESKTSLKVYNSGTVEVPAGIYRVFSGSMVTVKGDGIEVTTLETKDPWPDPAPAVMETFTVTKDDLRAFFTVPDAKSVAF